ncbi:MAG: Ig-like domain repeat protein [Candidatus Acidiferrum sp.]
MRSTANRGAFCVLAAFMLMLTLAPQTAAQTTPTLTVDADGNTHPINPDIYGLANYGLDATYAKEIQVPNIRWGGDGTTRYNWQVDSSNSGFDWYFMGGNGETTVTPSASADLMISTYKAASNAHTLLTIPIIPYVNKSAAWSCSFPVSVYGAQQSTNPYVHPNGDDCGNSIATDGTQLLDSNIYANHIDNTIALQQGWIQHLISTFGTAANGGVPYYQLDNEPGGWSNTHRDVEPVQPDYDTIISLGQQYAAMIKQTDPSAKVFGPVDFTLGGWIGTPSQQGGLYAGQYYLQQMAAYQQTNNQRILDYFDEHYYGGGSTDAAELESTRALWDPTFNSGSWVEQYYFDGPMQLIPRFQGWIQTYYPGTKLSISEYSFASGTNPLVDMLTETDVLGIFGTQALDFANMWNVPAATTPLAYSFRIYRNYDGAGSQFGDTSVNSTSTDQSQLSVYGALRSSDGALTVVAINKTTGAIQTSLTLTNFKPASTAAVYTYSNANLTQIVAGTPVAVVSNAVDYTFPAYSVTVFVFTPAPTTSGPTTTSLTASTTQLNAGQSVTFTSTVAPTSGSGSPTGLVTFSSGSTIVGVGTLNAQGIATCMTSSLAAGSYNVIATYSGDSSFGESTSSPVSVVVTALPKVATTISVTPPSAQLTTGQTLNLTIFVVPQSGIVTPTGTVSILDGQTQLAAPTLAGGFASFSTSTLTVGSHSITINYSGDTNFTASTSAVIPVVVSVPGKVTTNTLLSASATQITSGTSVTFSANVAPASGSAAPTGTVSFLDSQSSLSTATLSAGSAQFTAANLSAGSHSITAAYSGDSNFQPSTSAVATITVTTAAAPPDYSLSISGPALTVKSGTIGTMTLTVTPANGFKQSVSFACSGLPTGASCGFSPQSVTPAAAPVTATLSVQAPAAAMASAAASTTNSSANLFAAFRDARIPTARFGSIYLLAFALIALFFQTTNKRQLVPTRKFLRTLALATALAIPLIINGCATSSSSTPAGHSTNYTITVTATATNAPSHTQTLTLTVVTP